MFYFVFGGAKQTCNLSHVVIIAGWRNCIWCVCSSEFNRLIGNEYMSQKVGSRHTWVQTSCYISTWPNWINYEQKPQSCEGLLHIIIIFREKYQSEMVRIGLVVIRIRSVLVRIRSVRVRIDQCCECVTSTEWLSWKYIGCKKFSTINIDTAFFIKLQSYFLWSYVINT